MTTRTPRRASRLSSSATRDLAAVPVHYLQDLLVRAERSSERGDHAASARYYRALTAAAPDSAFGPRNLCVQLEAANDIPNAVVACRTALTRGGTKAGDYTRYVQIALKKTGPLTPLEEKELDVVLDHVAKEAQLGALIAALRCDVALRAGDTPALTTCVRQLEAQAPNDPKTVSFAWALALDRQDRAAALRLVDRAREIGMKPAGIAKMQQATSAMMRRKVGRFALVGVAIIILAAGVASIRGLPLAARRPPVSPRDLRSGRDRNVDVGPAVAQHGHEALRAAHGPGRRVELPTSKAPGRFMP